MQDPSSHPVKAAVWLRVSTDEDRQHTGNQLPDVAQFAAHHGYAVARTFEVDDSAWKDGKGGPAYRKAVSEALDAAHRGEFSVIIVWALDRITRNGVEDALSLIRRFRERGVTLVSVQESWLNGSAEVTDLLVAFAAWMAKQESDRRSERIKAGLARRKAEGKPIGRMPGARDRKPRRRSGYVRSWEDRREAAERAS